MSERLILAPPVDGGFVLFDALVALAILGAATAMALQAMGSNAARVKIDDEREMLATTARSVLVELRGRGKADTHSFSNVEITIHRDRLPEARRLDQIAVVARSRSAPYRTFVLFGLTQAADHD